MPPSPDNPFNLPPGENEVRLLRDQCFGTRSTYSNWCACRERWLRPASVAWLREHSRPIQLPGDK